MLPSVQSLEHRGHCYINENNILQIEPFKIAFNIKN